MKMPEDMHGVPVLITPSTRDELKRLETSADGLVLALRYMGISRNDPHEREAVLSIVAFLEDIKNRSRKIGKKDRHSQVEALREASPNWAFELSFVREERGIAEISQEIELYLQRFAEACFWLAELMECDLSSEARNEISKTYFAILDSVVSGCCAMVTGGSLCRKAAA